jgi:hypothetical protein
MLTEWATRSSSIAEPFTLVTRAPGCSLARASQDVCWQARLRLASVEIGAKISMVSSTTSSLTKVGGVVPINASVANVVG